MKAELTEARSAEGPHRFRIFVIKIHFRLKVHYAMRYKCDKIRKDDFIYDQLKNRQNQTVW